MSKNNSKYINTDYFEVDENNNTYQRKKQKFFSLSEVAQIVNEKTSVIDFWSRAFEKILNVPRPKVQRKYTQNNINQLIKIKSLIRDQNYSIAQALEEMSKENQSQVNNNVIQNNETQANTIESVPHIKEQTINSNDILEKFTSIVSNEITKQLQVYKKESIAELKKEISKAIPELNKNIYDNINKAIETNSKQILLNTTQVNQDQVKAIKNITNTITETLNEKFKNIDTTIGTIKNKEKEFTEKDKKIIEAFRQVLSDREKEYKQNNQHSLLYKIFHKSK